MDDASFLCIKEHADSPNLFDYIARIGSLKAAIKKADPDEIEHKSTELAEIAFSHDKDYQQHLADLAEAQKKREAQYLLDAIRRGKNERDFILDYIGKNPTADATPALAALFKQLDPALQRADLNQLQPLVDKIDVAIREDNLESAFIAAREANKSPEKNTETVPTADSERTVYCSWAAHHREDPVPRGMRSRRCGDPLQRDLKSSPHRPKSQRGLCLLLKMKLASVSSGKTRLAWRFTAGTGCIG